MLKVGCLLSRTALARLFVHRVLIALGAMLLNLQAIGIVASILAGDVVAVLAVFASQSDLGADIVTGHCRAFRR